MSTQTHDVAMHPGQRVTLTFRPEDAQGRPAPVQGIPENAVTTPEADNPIVSTTISDDGMTVTVHATGPLGTQQLSVTTTGDADMSGDPGNTDPAHYRAVVAQTTLNISVTPREATDAEHVLGTVEDDIDL